MGPVPDDRAAAWTPSRLPAVPPRAAGRDADRASSWEAGVRPGPLRLHGLAISARAPLEGVWGRGAKAESGTPKHGLIMVGLHGEGIAVIPNIRAYRALRELKRIGAGATDGRRLPRGAGRFVREIVCPLWETAAAAANAERLDLCGTSRR